MSIFHKVFSSLFLNKPSVHMLKPQSVNLYFKNSINPKYKLLNLSNYDCVEIEVLIDKTKEEPIYRLNLNVFGPNKSGIINVANFETKAETEKAVLILRNKLYSPGKTSFKIIATIIISLVSVLLLFNLLFGTGQRPRQEIMRITPEMMQQMQLQNNGQLSLQAIPMGIPNMNQGINPEEILRQAKMEANKVMSEGERGPTDAQRAVGVGNSQELNTSSNSTVELPKDPTIEGFINSLN